MSKPAICARLAAWPKAFLISRISSTVRGTGMGQPAAVISGQGTSEAALGCSRMKRCLPAWEIWMAGFGPVRLDGIGEERQPGDVLHAGDAELAGGGLAGVVVHPGVLDDDHRRPAQGHLFVVAEHPLGYRAVRVGEARVLRGLDDPVLETDVPDPAGLEQARKTRFHSDIPSLTHERSL